MSSTSLSEGDINRQTPLLGNHGCMRNLRRSLSVELALHLRRPLWGTNTHYAMLRELTTSLAVTRTQISTQRS